MKCDELKSYKGDVTIPVYGTIADAEVYLKKDVDEAIAELKQKLEDAKATAYAESVDAGMSERRLRRTLYKACANWANLQSQRMAAWGQGKAERRWQSVEGKCLKKAEEYL